MATNGLIVRNLMKIGQRAQKFKVENTYTQRRHVDFISLLFDCDLLGYGTCVL
jgi:hypothetical protein